MKRTAVFALVAILVLAAAGGAFAWGGHGGRGSSNRGMPGQSGTMMQKGMGFSGGAQANSQMMGMRNRGMMGMWANIEIPQEIRDKQVEMRKIAIDMQAEMRKNPIDRAKIEELHNKRVEMRNELGGWMLKQRLDMIEKLQK
ncbi:MAG: hypothetical protein GX181_07795 [Synergistaceae bacterium]|nr:hypothetical protein [Synergistota bacterium]NLM71843.1 hypothetical protein [Synergistaceae bacterium]